MATTAAIQAGQARAGSSRALSAIRSKLSRPDNSTAGTTTLAAPSPQRREQSKNEQPLRLGPEGMTNVSGAECRHKTVFYLAYGSNLAHETFQGNRGIKPLSQVNVLVPELRLTFDLPGIPYNEPCFANSARRTADEKEEIVPISEKTPLIWGSGHHHKDRWNKGLVGVVYEVTLEDYARIIATEGGGAAYQDILVSCYPLTDAYTVPEIPTTEPFKAHTLFAPAIETPSPGDPPPKDGGRPHRPDTSYAQPSARYLKLITDGAEEHALPHDYRDYLSSIQPYTITTKKQRLGQAIFAALWIPLFVMIIGLSQLFSDKKGRSPKWLVAIQTAMLAATWRSYDTLFKPTFGDGERTIEKDDEEQQCRYLPPQRGKLRKAPPAAASEEKRCEGELPCS